MTITADQTSNQEVQHAREYLNEIVRSMNDGHMVPDFGNLHLKVTSSVVVGSDVAQELINIAEHRDGIGTSGEKDFDMIAMTTPGQSGVVKCDQRDFFLWDCKIPSRCQGYKPSVLLWPK